MQSWVRKDNTKTDFHSSSKLCLEVGGISLRLYGELDGQMPDIVAIRSSFLSSFSQAFEFCSIALVCLYLIWSGLCFLHRG